MTPTQTDLKALAGGESMQNKESDTMLAERHELNGQPDGPLAMLQLALERGTDPDALKKLMDLAESWKAQRAAEEFSLAMNLCQRLMPCIVKDKVNKFLNDAPYASLENIQTAIRPVYTQQGLSLSYGTEDSKLEGHVRVVCDVRHVGGHKERYGLDIPLDSTGAKGGSNKSGPQAVVSSTSYARRVLATMIFNLTIANTDIDGNTLAALDKITDAQAIDVEAQLTDQHMDTKRFVEWLRTAGHCVGEPAIRNIAARNLPKVMDALAKRAREKGGGKS